MTLTDEHRADPAFYNEISKIWHPTLNSPLPSDLSDISFGKKVWFMGDCGHEWDNTLFNYIKSSRQCPFCTGKRLLSGFNDLSTTHPHIAAQWDERLNANVDILKVAAGSPQKAWWKCEQEHQWEARIFARSKKEQGCPYCFGRFTIIGVDDLQTTHPKIAAEWHPTKNSTMTPDKVKLGSNFKAWWVCSEGHEWHVMVSSRKTNNCPTCGNKKVLSGYNDFKTLYPNIAAEWHPTKNETSAAQYTFKSAFIAWWLCKNGHEWEARIFSRQVSGCPYCANFTLKSGFNDFGTKNPELVEKWWDFDKNEISPYEIFTKDERIFWWKCSMGHGWQNAIKAVSMKTNCPVCDNKKVMSGINDLNITHPHLASEWHSKRNGDLSPSQFLYTSNTIVWWQDKLNHEWEATIFERSRNHRNCPFCSNQKVLIGFNDLVTTHPHIAKEWHPTKNTVLPTEVMKSSSVPLWWKCKEGHSWQVRVATRTNAKTGCPICAKKTSKDEQELAEFVQRHVSIVQHYRKLIHPFELDMYAEKEKIAIEFNGTYWHNETNKKPDYHFKKWLACKNKGVTLFQVWEDDWKRNPVLVKRLLVDALKPDAVKSAKAEDLVVKVITAAAAKHFFDVNSLDQFPAESVFYGLHDDATDVLHAVMAVTVDGETLHVNGYCDDGTIAGGFTTLTDYISRVSRSKRVNMLVRNDTPADRLMLSEGFTEAGQIEPGFTYCIGDVRTPESVLNVEFFKSHTKLKHENGLNMDELIQLNKIARIWDAGKTEWVKEVKR